jgi:glycosyltransferase involved in cell wall biosynthesis
VLPAGTKWIGTRSSLGRCGDPLGCEGRREADGRVNGVGWTHADAGGRLQPVAPFRTLGERAKAQPAVGFGVARDASDRPSADVSVVIPVYNHERFVGLAIDSVLSQTVRPREILCIDDGSTDSSARVVQAMAERHPTVRFWSRSNKGAHRTINEGIREARGRYLAILNSDDLYHPERLCRCLAVLEEDPGVTAVATGISFVDESDNAIRYPWYEETHAFYEEVGDLGLALVNGNFLMTTSNLVARRAVFDEIGGFDDLRYAHDLDFFLRFLAHGKRLTVLPEQLLTYRVHGSNTISEAPQDMGLETAVVVAFFARRLASWQGESHHDLHYLSRLLEVTERHQWTRVVSLALLHLQREGGSVSSPAACLSDPAFRSEACHEAGAAAPATAGAASAPPVLVSEAEQPVYTVTTTATAPRWRRMLDLLLRRPLPRRFFASVRWRSGLDADLQELRERLDRVAAALDTSRVQAENAEPRLDAQVRRIAHAHDPSGSRVTAAESHQTDAERAGAGTGEQHDEPVAIMRGRLGRPRNAAR